MKATQTFNEFSYFYFDKGADTKGSLKIVDKCSQVPDEIEDFCKLDDAIALVQKLGCCGICQHQIKDEYHQLCLTVLAKAVDNIGETFPLVLRGVRSKRPDSDYKILFGTRDQQVAAFYGETIKEYHNVRGVRVKCSRAKSVKTDDWDEQDDEIIFFPS